MTRGFCHPTPFLPAAAGMGGQQGVPARSAGLTPALINSALLKAGAA